MGPLDAPLWWWAMISLRHDDKVFSEGADLLHLVGSAAGDGLVDQGGGIGGVVGQVDVSNRLLCQPCAEQLVMGVPDAKPKQHATTTAVIEPLGAGVGFPPERGGVRIAG